jgi:hypothetical protein
MKTKSFSYQRVIKLRDKIYDSAFSTYVGRVVSREVIYGLHRDLLSCLPQSVPQGAVFETIRVLSGKTFTQKTAATLAWRIAGNIDLLLADTPVLPWTRQFANERVPVCVEHIVPAQRRNISGFTFHCRALAGTPCTMLFPEFVSDRSCAAISRTLGFSAPWGPYPYSTPLHFVNLLFFAHIDAERSRRTPAFTQVTASSSMVAANRRLIAVRCRAAPCPLAFEHACERCYFGYDQCDFATHARTYVAQYCPACEADGFFNPGEPAVVCVRCQQLPQEEKHE